MKSFISSELATPSRYRSVRYKTISKETNIESNQCSHFVFPAFNHNMKKMQEKRDRKNYSQMITSQNVKKRIRTETIDVDEQGLRTMKYMDSYNFMMEVNKSKRKKTSHIIDNEQVGDGNINEGLIKAMQKRRMKMMRNMQVRVKLPNLSQMDSHFTVLDNVNLPINYIRQEIQRMTVQIKIQQTQMKKVGNELKDMRKKIQQNFTQIESRITKGFSKLRGLLKKNGVYHQQSSLKLKQAFQKNIDFLPQFYSSLEKCKQSCLGLQQTIFNELPYELKQNEEFQETIENKYF